MTSESEKKDFLDSHDKPRELHFTVFTFDGKDKGHHWQVWLKERSSDVRAAATGKEYIDDAKMMSPPKGYHYCSIPICECYFKCPHGCECLEDFTGWKEKPKHKTGCQCKCKLKKTNVFEFVCSQEHKGF